MLKQGLISLIILAAFGCADVPRIDQQLSYNSGSCGCNECPDKLTEGEATGSDDTEAITYWPQQIGTTESDLAYSIFVDPSDNIFITGNTDGNLLDHTNNGSYDIFLIKFTENGSIFSSKLIGAKPYYNIDGMGNTNRIVPLDRGNGLFVNSSGNIYLTGFTSGYLSGPTGKILNVPGQTYTTWGSTFRIGYTHTYDGFIIGMDKNLDQVWAHQTNEISNCCGNIQKMSDNTIDRLGNIYVVGETNVYDFDGNIRDNAQFGGDNNRDIILVKYDSDGQKQWSARTGTILDDAAGSIIVDSLGNIYICWFGSKDGYITKYDSEGNQLRFTRIMTPYINGSYGAESFLDIKIDNEDNIYVVGGTSGWLDGNRNLGGEDIIIIKLNSNLSKLWSRQLGSSSNDSAISLAVNNNEIFILGSSDGNFDGKQQIGEKDIVLIKFNSDGEKQWVRQLGTDKYDSPQDIAVNSRGDLFITGSTRGAFEDKNSEGKDDIFVIKYDSDGNQL